MMSGYYKPEGEAGAQRLFPPPSQTEKREEPGCLLLVKRMDPLIVCLATCTEG